MTYRPERRRGQQPPRGESPRTRRRRRRHGRAHEIRHRAAAGERQRKQRRGKPCRSVHGHSAPSATTGSSFAALRAGMYPKISPVAKAQPKASSTVGSENTIGGPNRASAQAPASPPDTRRRPPRAAARAGGWVGVAAVWERVFQHLAADADNEYAMIDSTIVRAHQRSAGAQKKPARTRRSGDPAAD